MDYIQKETISNVTLSRSGRYLALIHRSKGEERIKIKDFETGDERTLTTKKNNDLTGFISFGGSDDKLFYLQKYRNQSRDMLIYDILRRKFIEKKKYIGNGYPSGINDTRDTAKTYPTINNITNVWNTNPTTLVAEKDFNSRLSTYHYNVEKNSMTHIKGSPPNTVTLFHDENTGLPRIAITSERRRNKRGLNKEKRGAERAYFLPSKKSDWQHLPFFDNDFSSYKKIYDAKCIVDLAPDGRTIYFTKTTEHGTRGLFTYDLETQKELEMVASNPKYDLFRIGYKPGNDGRIYFSDKNKRFIGFEDYSIIPETVWADPYFSSIQNALDKALPMGFINDITDWNFNETKFIVKSHNDTEFGNYFVFDVSNKSLIPIGKARPQIAKEFCGKQIALQIPLRDGREMVALLRLPTGFDHAKDLPTIVSFPHDLYSRAMWHNSASEQLLAKNGYASLRLNPRGCWGFGRDYFERGLLDSGRQAAEDIVDAVNFLIKTGTIDATRLCLQGEWLNSYFCLKVLSNQPDLFCCSIIKNPLSDYGDYYPKFQRAFESRMRWSIFEAAIESNNKNLNTVFNTNEAIKGITNPVFILNKDGGYLRFYVWEQYANELRKKLKKQGVECTHVSNRSDQYDYDAKKYDAAVKDTEALLDFLKKTMPTGLDS